MDKWSLGIWHFFQLCVQLELFGNWAVHLHTAYNYGVKPPMCLPAFFPDDMPVNSDTHLDSESRFFFSLVRQGPTQVWNILIGSHAWCNAWCSVTWECQWFFYVPRGPERGHGITIRFSEGFLLTLTTKRCLEVFISKNSCLVVQNEAHWSYLNSYIKK